MRLFFFGSTAIFFLTVNTIIIPFEENRLQKTLVLSMKDTSDQLEDGYRFLYKRPISSIHCSFKL
jgi:hypothetical protein